MADSAQYIVWVVDLDMARNAKCDDWTPHVDGGGSAECDTLQEAIELVDEIRECQSQDAYVEGPGVPTEYALFDGGRKRYPL